MAINPRAVFVRTFAIASSSLLIAAALGAPPAAANDLRDIRIGDHGQLTHVVIEADGPFCADFALAANPFRLSIALPQLAGAKPAPRAYGLVSRSSWTNDRFVLELKQPARIADLFVVPPGDGKGFRRVVKLERVSAEEFADSQRGLAQTVAVAACDTPPPVTQKSAEALPAANPPQTQPQPQAAISPAPQTAIQPAPQTPPQTKPQSILKAAAPPPAASAAPSPSPASRIPKDKRWTVVIDPGHGGDDPGATSPGGLKEKALTLAMAQVLKRQMEASKRYHVLLTRNDDQLVHLRDRTAFADRDDVHLFISLHADTIGAKAIRGLSVYTLSNKASDSESEALAAKENSVDQHDAPIATPQTAFEKSDYFFRLNFDSIALIALPFRKLVIDEMRRSGIDTLPSPDRSAGFVVLKTRKVPSVLIEMGYLSNAADEKLLRQTKHQERFAAAITKAADRFFACPEVWKWFAGSEDHSVAGRGVSCGPSVAEGKGGDGG